MRRLSFDQLPVLISPRQWKGGCWDYTHGDSTLPRQLVVIKISYCKGQASRKVIISNSSPSPVPEGSRNSCPISGLPKVCGERLRGAI